jgi:hypothetical protein
MMSIREVQQRKASQPPKTVGGALYMLREVYFNLGYPQVPASFASRTEKRLRSRKR